MIAAGTNNKKKFKTLSGTVNYMPPEAIKGGEQAQKSGRYSSFPPKKRNEMFFSFAPTCKVLSSQQTTIRCQIQT